MSVELARKWLVGRTSLRIILSDVGERRLGPKRRRLISDFIKKLVSDQKNRPDSVISGGFCEMRLFVYYIAYNCRFARLSDFSGF
jgi:hypothetical protein